MQRSRKSEGEGDKKENRVCDSWRQCRNSMSGSLDPFKPFHRHFTRLHNAATLIKINYTLASVRSFIRHIPPPPLPPIPLTCGRFFLFSFFSSPILVPPLFLHRTFDHQIARHYWLGNHPHPLLSPLSFICTLFEI